ncbi:MAG: hypothetical protein IKG87_16120 [Clostridia bacterium]|nr:hypothetical protein [Clostridia bacterium]
MFGIDKCEKFRTATIAHTLPTGLCDQPAGFLQQYPGLFLILKLYALKFHGFSDIMQLHEGGVSALRKLKVYLDTSIISYLDQQDAPDKMNETLRLWEMFRQEKFDVFHYDPVR